MRRVLLTLTLVTLIATLGFAQTHVPAAGCTQATAGIEGDVYLLTKAGTVARAAGRQVRLILHTDSVAAMFDRLCAEGVGRMKTHSREPDAAEQ